MFGIISVISDSITNMKTWTFYDPRDNVMILTRFEEIRFENNLKSSEHCLSNMIG